MGRSIYCRRFMFGFVFVFSYIFGLSQTQAAGQTGHADLMRLLSAIYGFNIEAAQHIASVNQSADDVPGSAATAFPFGGVVAEKGHFARVVTKSDLREKDVLGLLKNNGERTFWEAFNAFMMNGTMGGGVAALSNAEGAEMIGKSMVNGDGTTFLLGMHYLMDVAGGFHDGYMGALNAPIPILSKFLKVPLGHLVDGDSPDALAIGKIALSMVALGPFLITLRETQRNNVGVNTQWMNEMRGRGVDMNDNSAIMRWFFDQPEVEKCLKAYLPATQSEVFVQKVAESLEERLRSLHFFKSDDVLQDKIAALVARATELRNDGSESWLTNDLIRQMIDESWREGHLYERKIVKEVFTDYLDPEGKTATLEALLIPNKMEDLPDYVRTAILSLLATKGGHMPHTRGWALEQILAKVTRGMMTQPWEKFDTAHVNEDTTSARLAAEKTAMDKLEKHFFNRTSAYSYNPGIEYWSKVFDRWTTLLPDTEGQSIRSKVITFFDIILSTKIHEGNEVHSLEGRLKLEIFLKTLRFVVVDGFFRPLTSNGNFRVKHQELRRQVIAEIQSKHPQGLLTEEMLARSIRHNRRINQKYNSDTPVGPIQKTANVIVKTLMYFDPKKTPALSLNLGGVPRCADLLGP